MTTLTDLNNPFSPCEVKKIAQIAFGIFEREHVRALSVCEVSETDLYDNGVPKKNGLNDPLMGTTDYRIPCASCNMDFRTCPGHFGHIDLAKPVFNVGLLPAVLTVLRCVCYSCGRLLASAEDPRFIAALRIKNPKTRLAKLVALTRTKDSCDPGMIEGKGGCGSMQPVFKRDGVNIMVDFSASSNLRDEDFETGDSKRVFTSEETLAVFNRITVDDMRLLGFDPDRARPSWMIIQALLVVPPCVRPHVQFGTDRSEDDLTLKLLDILKVNKQLKRYEVDGVAQHVVQDSVAVLQYHVATLMNNEIPGLPVAVTKSKKPIKSIRERLKGKEGRLRGNLMGKRVDFSARTVITGDPNLALDQVGVPRSIAMNLTFPETVTSMNIDSLRKAVARGPSTWPGARYITRTDGTRFDLRHCAGNPGAMQLEIGYKVERHVRDGDYVLFNRQPSLHKMSIMGHKVKVLPWSTFRCNLSVTSPYNADFDGDEMNLHLAQSHETRAEIKHLCLVPKQIVSPQGNRPVMGIVQDSLLGLANMTSRDTFIDRALMMQLCLWVADWDGILPPPVIWKPMQLWSGKQLFTLALATCARGNNKLNLMRDGSLRRKQDHDYFTTNDGRVIIRNSEHLSGIVCKRTAGTGNGSIIHVMWQQCGPERTKDFISNVQKIVNNWLVTQGFTVGISDIFADDYTLQRVRETLDESYVKVDDLIALARMGKLDAQPGKSLLESFENRVNQELNQAREASGRIAAENLTSKNNIIAMVNAGSKGSTINISQIMACVGQQNVEGKRIPFGFQGRSLPHFLKYDYGPDSRGFVYNSYLSGLNPHEMFFHAMGGREGIIDTACKTSETGYIQRRLVKAMEDVIVTYDRSVRNSNGEIVQFLYGEDGMAGEFIEDQFLDLLRLDYEKIEKRFKHDFRDPHYGEGWLANRAMREDLMYSVEKQTILVSEWQQLTQAHRRLCTEIFPYGESKQHLPVNIPRLIQIAKTRFPHDDIDSVNPIEIIQALDRLICNEVMVFSHPTLNSIYREAQNNATTLFAIHCRTNLNSRKLIERDKLGPQALEWLFREVARQYQKSLAPAGEVVGALAAQSIGEPATQMTLNTFHFAGVGSKNVTLGVPRLRELINVAKVVNTPSLTVHLCETASRDSVLAKNVQGLLEYTTLDKVIAAVQIVYDPDPVNTVIKRDEDWVRDFYEFPGDEETDVDKLGRWMIRIQLLEKLITEGMTMRDIGLKVLLEYKSDDLDVIWTDDNSDELVLRLRLKKSGQPDPKAAELGDEKNTDDDQLFLSAFAKHGLNSLAIRGVPGINKVYMRENKTPVFDPLSGRFPIMGGRWILDTDGCNLAKVIVVESVDFACTTSNSIVETLEVLGIEAARKMLLREIRNVISFDGSYVNYRHLAILCDVMAQRGTLMPITRNGINRVEKGCIAKCSFEETVEILMQAACFGEADNLRGVTENVMVGQLASFGTGVCDIIINDAKLNDPATHFESSAMDGLGVANDHEGYVSVPRTSHGDFQASPFSPFSPAMANSFSAIASPQMMSQFSPLAASPRSHISPMQMFSPTFNGTSPAHFNAQSPMYSGNFSPNLLSPTSQFSPSLMSPNYSPTSPLAMMSPTFSPTSPQSPNYSIASPTYSPTSPLSPTYSPTSPMSPTYSPTSPMSPTYSPTSPMSPNYSPTSPMSPNYSPTSPMSPSYSLTSPNQAFASPTYSPSYLNRGISSPINPTSPLNYPLMPMSPNFPQTNAPLSPMMNPTSPNFSRAAASPTYSPSSPIFGMGAQNPQSPGAYSPIPQAYSPVGRIIKPSQEPVAPLSPSLMQSPRYDPLLSPIFRPPQD